MLAILILKAQTITRAEQQIDAKNAVEKTLAKAVSR
jgi:hypothetical protein